MCFKNRLNSIFDELGMPSRGRATILQKLTGVTNSAAQKWLKGESIPHQDSIIVICKKYNKSPEWLEYGRLHISEKRLSFVTGSNPIHKVEICDIYFLNDSKSKGSEPYMEPMPFSKTYLITRGIDPESSCMVIAPDSRMSPEINKGDAMLVDRSKQELIEQKIYVFRIAGSTRASQVVENMDGSISLVSKNPDPSYQNERISAEDKKSLRIVGQVVWHGGFT